MVKVYFQYKDMNSDLVAIFDDETTYMNCLHALKAEARENGMTVNESINDGDIRNTEKGLLTED